MEKNEHKLAFELIVGDENGEIQNGDVPVRWCLTPELVKELEDNNVFDPHILLLSVSRSGIEQQRKLIPLTELMTFIRFYKAGENKLYGFILDGNKGRKQVHSTYTRRVCNRFSTEILSYEDKPYTDLPFVVKQTEITVDIPDNVFGKEPGKWMKWFVNLWHDNKTKDECHYRQRMILAFTLKWLPVLIFAIGKTTWHATVTGSLKLTGYMDVEFLRSFRPFHWSDLSYHLLGDLTPASLNLFIIKRKTRRKNYSFKVPMFFTLPFIPIILLIQSGFVLFTGANFISMMLIITAVFFAAMVIVDSLIVIFELISHTSKKMRDVGSTINQFKKATISYVTNNNQFKITTAFLFVVIISVTSLTSPFGFISVFFVGLSILLFLLMIFADNIINKLDSFYNIPPEKNEYSEIRELLCPKDTANLKPNIKYIPKEQQTIRLRYLDLKNKICKPMQR